MQQASPVDLMPWPFSRRSGRTVAPTGKHGAATTAHAAGTPAQVASPITAADVMTRAVLNVREDVRLAAVASAMLAERQGCVVVMDGDDRPRGVITEADFAIKDGFIPFTTEKAPQLFGEWVSMQRPADAYARGSWLTAGEVMHAPLVTCAPTTPVSEVIQLMRRHQVAYVPVVGQGALVGVVGRHDLLKLVASPSPPPPGGNAEHMNGSRDSDSDRR